MADFKLIIDKTLKHEGGYANVKGDSGGRTYKGIAEKHNPNWEGWEIIKKHEPIDHGKFINDHKLDLLVKDLYKAKYWDKIQLSEVQDQRVANQIFDWHVNSGGSAIKRIQKVLGVTADGIVGAKTIEAINRYGVNLNQAIKTERIDFYNDIVAANPSQKKFLNGWLNRANSF